MCVGLSAKVVKISEGTAVVNFEFLEQKKMWFL